MEERKIETGEGKEGWMTEIGEDGKKEGRKTETGEEMKEERKAETGGEGRRGR